MNLIDLIRQIVIGMNQARSLAYESDNEAKNMTSGVLDKIKENDKSSALDYSDDDEERVDIDDESPVLRKTPTDRTSADKGEGKQTMTRLLCQPKDNQIKASN